MVIDLDKCTGCQACSLACASENNLPVVPPEQARMRREIEWNEMLLVEIGGEEVPLPRPCMNCDVASCVKVCPTGSRFYFSEGRVVLQSYDRCIGCRMCMCSCPYNANYFIWTEPDWRYTSLLNKDEVVFEGLGRVGPYPNVLWIPLKCIFCFHRLVRLKQDLEEGVAGGLSRIFKGPIGWEEVAKAIDVLMRYLTGEGEVDVELEGWEIRYLPACVSTCPARARIFGDLDDESSLASKYASSPRAFRLLEELGHSPKVIYLRPVRR